MLGRKIPKLLILNDISSISQDEDLFDAVFRWPKSAKNGISDEFPQNLRFLKIVLGRKLGNYMIFNGIHLFSRNEDFGETHQKSHFLLILAI